MEEKQKKSWSEITRTRYLTLPLEDPAFRGKIAYGWFGSATPGEDYLELTGKAVIPVGELETVIDVSSIDNSKLEGLESIEIWLDEFNLDGTYAI